jgi:glycosyltransferase involved in cell wall biosynthesis
MELTSDQVGVLAPAYREVGRIGAVVRGIRRFAEHVVVIDDGSADGTAEDARAAGAHVIVHEANRGKGAALQTGFAYARRAGYVCVITLDADGQHDPAHIPDFLRAYRESGCPVIVGNRMDDPRGMPFVRRQTNRVMSALLSRRMGQRVPDTQSGYRLYRIDVLPYVYPRSGGFAAESEVLLRLAAAGYRIGAVPIRAIYGNERSNIRPWRDTRLFFRMLREYDRERASMKATEKP